MQYLQSYVVMYAQQDSAERLRLNPKAIFRVFQSGSNSIPKVSDSGSNSESKNLKGQAHFTSASETAKFEKIAFSDPRKWKILLNHIFAARQSYTAADDSTAT